MRGVACQIARTYEEVSRDLPLKAQIPCLYRRLRHVVFQNRVIIRERQKQCCIPINWSWKGIPAWKVAPWIFQPTRRTLHSSVKTERGSARGTSQSHRPAKIMRDAICGPNRRPTV